MAYRPELPTDRRIGGDRAAGVVLAVGLVVAFPVILKLGSYHWFLRDDWSFLAGRSLFSLDDLFRPHGSSHWSTLPIIVYGIMWRVFGLRTYLPYQALVVLVHLSTALLLWALMRRAGVRPWMATAAAAPFVLFGPGAENIVWAFQIGFTGSIALGLLQLLLAMHDGPSDRRDWIGLAAGALSLMCSGVGIATAMVVGLAVCLVRGWRIAAFHTAPLAIMYVLWAVVEDPATGVAGFGRPSLETLGRWVASAQEGTFLALGRYQVVAVLLALMLVGLVLTRRDGWRSPRVAVPVALLIGHVVFSAAVAHGRWPFGIESAQSSRYLYLGAAFTLPALAVAADAIAQRWRILAPVLLALLWVAMPANVRELQAGTVFNEGYFDKEERVLTTVVRMPFASAVPRDVRPIPDVFHSPELTIGFLLDAVRSGRLSPSAGSVRPREANEMRIRLGVAQRDPLSAPQECQPQDSPSMIRPAEGTVYELGSPVVLSTVDQDGRPTSQPVRFAPRDGRRLTIELPDLALRIGPAPGATSFEMCERR